MGNREPKYNIQTKKKSGKLKNSLGNAEAAEGEIWVSGGDDDVDDDEKMHVLVGRRPLLPTVEVDDRRALALA